MRLKPGTLAWLIAHDLTLNWRRFMDMFARLSPLATWAVCAAGAIVLHLLAWPIVKWLVRLQHEGGVAGTTATAIVMVSIFAWMTAQGLLGAARMLQDRGSADLLLGSPLPVRLILASRAAGIAASSFGSVAILVLPVADMGAVVDGPAWLAVYPALVALSLIGTTVGLAVAIGLFLWFGPRRARLISQLAAALIGGAFLLGMQIAAMLPATMRGAVADYVSTSAIAGLLDPAKALPLPALIACLVALGAVLFAAAIVLLAGSFARASLRAAGASDDANSHRPARDCALRFGSGLARTLRRKEWRLLSRDHTLFAQLALQIIYTVPIAVVLVRGVDNIPLATALAPAIVVIAAQIAASLAWITVSGEDAPELIAAAPVTRAEVELAKVTAVGAPVLVILALPLAGLALLSPLVAVLVALFAAGASVSTALLNLWHPMPGNRRGMLRRHSQSKLMALLEHLLAMLWAVAIVLAVVGTAWALLPIALALLLLAACSPARRRKPPREAASTIAMSRPKR